MFIRLSCSRLLPTFQNSVKMSSLRQVCLGTSELKLGGEGSEALQGTRFIQPCAAYSECRK